MEGIAARKKRMEDDQLQMFVGKVGSGGTLTLNQAKQLMIQVAATSSNTTNILHDANNNSDDELSDVSLSGYSRSTNSLPSTSASQSTLDPHLRMERDLETKDHIIGKLREERAAYEKYSKELEAERSELHQENKALSSKMHIVDNCLFNIEQLERENDALQAKMEALSRDLAEERQCRKKTVHEKKLMEMSFSTDLLQMTKELEQGSKQAMDRVRLVFNTDTPGKPDQTQSDPKDNSNWSMKLLKVQRLNIQYTKKKSMYLLENGRMRRTLDDRVGDDGRLEIRQLDHFQDVINQFEKVYSECWRKHELVKLIHPKMLEEIMSLQRSIIVDNGLNISGRLITSSSNDELLNGFVGGGQHIWDEEVEDVNIERFKQMLDQLASDGQQTQVDQSDMNDQYQFGLWRELFARGTHMVGQCMATLKDMQTESLQQLPTHCDVNDPLEIRLEALLDIIEPYLADHDDGDDHIGEDNDELLQETIDELSNDLVSSTQAMHDRMIKATEYHNSAQNVIDEVSDFLDTISKEQDKIEKFKNDVATQGETKTIQYHALQKMVSRLLSLKSGAQLLVRLRELQSTPFNYIATNEDDDHLDVMVASVIRSLGSSTPSESEATTTTSWLMPTNFKRISEGQYQFGTITINTTILSGKLVVRVGGGFITFQEYLVKHGRAQCIKLLQSSR
ncbi:hypothetical protein SAMD00019534_042070 [Acytostelium subglobosum LB1]|uniref:hypothetical protein n=1 Tax=Acytostelium subglobosum LB1 TaxID=1410327 RepID=UPI0006450B3D|nr:hypothetical protein SAMD00019534_042070 [Acytostelium subglobosum LB1]GAM21032.1 hypothetical protein SAMD00019534_042070 [Acytostelium subglobosum LB1]|eukprot:XP_012756166.1 hypothetical protein SAMD00019534_042070 [Acytostelium subglobosum LB1]